MINLATGNSTIGQDVREGLKELAVMIAIACRRGDIGTRVSNNIVDANLTNELPLKVCLEPSDSPSGYVYTEVIGIEHFMRKKVHKTCS